MESIRLNFSFIVCILFLTLFQHGVANALPEVSICGVPYTLPVNQWRQISIPCLPAAGDNSLSTILGDDLSGDNGIDWILFGYDSTGNRYYSVDSSDPLQSGVGYWILQSKNATAVLDMPDGSQATPTTTPTTHCTRAGGCLELELASVQDDIQWQMPGFPFSASEQVSEFRIASAECAHPDGCTLTEAAEKNLMHHTLFSFNGTSYSSLTTDSTIAPWTGFWAVTLQDAFEKTATLLISKRQSRSDYTVVAANDLGMHCADLDGQVFSILPPFNVVHAQVIAKGSTPSVLDNNTVTVRYSAATNPNDPVGVDSINTTSANYLPDVFKTNFWDQIEAADATVGGLAYGTLYPGVQVVGLLGGPDLTHLCDNPSAPLGCPSALSLFDPIPVSRGIPMPEGDALFPENPADPPQLITTQQEMPGSGNVPQEFLRFDKYVPFFVNFDFGFRGRDLNWFAADGIPILPVDDAGRRNPYPLMTISAHDKVNDQSLASVDIVLPVAAEADCQNCHVDPIDCNDPDLPADARTTECLGAAIDSAKFSVLTLEDIPPGVTRLEQLRNVAKINILRLHDATHGEDYQNWDTAGNLVARACDPQIDPDSPNCLANQTPIQCSRCHYSPALDLAQAGPVNEPEQGEQGRQQPSHPSMSLVMHKHHGTLPPFDDESLFPDMPGPVGRSAEAAKGILNKTCYQCHPGKLTDCLRGAMATGGAVCQDCHGDMEQVGNDFTLRVNSGNPGDFILDGSLRVSWASEPGCQSCHTGDAQNKNHPAGAIIAADGIRLLQAYNNQLLTIPGIPEAIRVAAIHSAPNSRFAENQAINESGATVDVLYRLSKGHGGIMCEGCHNSTHAIWPARNPLANDNVAANQLQGHGGTVIECDTCHLSGSLGNTLEGPHGMHPVGGSEFADGGHEDLAENDPDACRACHGKLGEGTVLSRVATDRSFIIEECEKGTLCPGQEVENFTVNLTQGEQITCSLCHENKLTED